MLLLIDNVYRLVQAGGEVSGLLGRLPSRVGYQPTLASEIAELEERIASVAGAAITSIQAVYVPADDFTDPAVAEIFTHLDSSIVLSRDMASEGLYPAVDPLASSSSLLDPRLVGEAHYRTAQDVRKTIAHYRELQEIIALLGIEELSAADRSIVTRARRLISVPDAALHGDHGIHRQARAVGGTAGHVGRLSRNPGWRGGQLGGSVAVHGRRSGRGTRQGSDGGAMKLTVTTPLAIVLDADDIAHVRAEDATGAFGILPHHADFLTALPVSVVSWRNLAGQEHHVAVRGGMLEVSHGDTVAIATREAVASDDLHRLETEVLAAFRHENEAERTARTDAERLYLAAIRRISQLLRPERVTGLPGVRGLAASQGLER